MHRDDVPVGVGESERATERPVERALRACRLAVDAVAGRPACLARGAGVNSGRVRRGSRSGRRSFASLEAGLDEANHPVHELEEFGGARGSRQGLGFIALVELTKTGDG